jgi:hypothetical protein
MLEMDGLASMIGDEAHIDIGDAIASRGGCGGGGANSIISGANVLPKSRKDSISNDTPSVSAKVIVLDLH